MEYRIILQKLKVPEVASGPKQENVTIAATSIGVRARAASLEKGCIEADFWNRILVSQHASRSTRYTNFCTASNSKFTSISSSIFTIDLVFATTKYCDVLWLLSKIHQIIWWIVPEFQQFWRKGPRSPRFEISWFLVSVGTTIFLANSPTHGCVHLKPYFFRLYRLKTSLFLLFFDFRSGIHWKLNEK